MEDLWPAATFQRNLQGIETELRVKAVGELLAEHIPGEQIHDRHQIEESLLQREVGDVSRPDLVHCRDRADSTRHGKRSEGSPGTVVRVFGRSPVNPCGA